MAYWNFSLPWEVIEIVLKKKKSDPPKNKSGMFMYFRILHSDRPFAEKGPFFLPKMKVCFNAHACATYVRFTNVNS